MPPKGVVGIPSERQVQALELLSNDLSEFDVAHKMGVTRRTVADYVAQVAEHLGVRRTPAVIMMACSSGLIPLAFGRVSVPAGPFQDLMNIGEALKDATSMDLPALQARATTVLATLATQNSVTGVLCNRGGSTTPR